MGFWPNDIRADDLRSPHQLLEQAAKELQQMCGQLSASVLKTEIADRVVLAFQIVGPDARGLDLFEAYHRNLQPYPAVIVPPDLDIPDFLQRKRYIRGSGSAFADIARVIEGTRGRWVENPWICASPAEFRDKLTQLLAEDQVKAMVFSLLTDSPQEPPLSDREVDDDNNAKESGGEHG